MGILRLYRFMATADTTCNYLCCIWPWILPDMICLLIFDGYSLAMDGKFENHGTKDVGFINDLTLSGWATNLGVAYFWTKPWEQKYVWGGNNQVDYPETIDMNSCMFYWPRKRKHAILAAQWRDVKCQVKIYDCMLVCILYRSWTWLDKPETYRRVCGNPGWVGPVRPIYRDILGYPLVIPGLCAL